MPKRSAKEEVIPSEPSSDGDDFDDDIEINGDIEDGSTEAVSSEDAASEGRPTHSVYLMIDACNMGSWRSYRHFLRGSSCCAIDGNQTFCAPGFYRRR